jgi:oligosaccharide repeat unit polymerase
MANDLILYTYKFILVLVSLYIIINFRKIRVFNFLIILIFIFFGPAFFTSNVDIDYAFYTECICLSLTWICLFLGKFFSNEILAKWRKKVAKPPPPRAVRKNIIWCFVIFFYIILFLSLFAYGGIQSLKIISGAANGLTPDDLKKLRFEGGPQGWIRPFYAYVSGFAGSVSLFALYSIYNGKSRVFEKIFVFSFVALILLSGIATLHKSIAFFYLLQLGFWAFLRKNPKWELKTTHILWFVGLTLGVLIPAYLFLTTAIDASEALDSITGRVTEEPNRVLREYFIWWPKYLDHTLGTNIRIVHSLFGSGTYQPAFVTVIMQNMNPNDYIAGTWPAMFIADAWVDFSYFGVILYSIITGFIVNAIDLYLQKNRDGLSVVLFCSLLTSINTLLENSLITAMISGGLLLYPLFTILITKRRKKSVVSSEYFSQ